MKLSLLLAYLRRSFLIFSNPYQTVPNPETHIFSAFIYRAPDPIMPERQPISVLFVCLGNICRSTMAEGIFQSLANKAPYQGRIKRIDSCGTGAYHVGEEPDDRTMATLEEHGITDYIHRGRKVGNT